VTSTPLNAEGRMEAFRGEDPNGVWTLSIQDDLATNTGTLNSWSIDVSTIPTPVTTTTNVTQSPNLAILDVATVSDTMAVAVGGTFLSSVTLYTEIKHTFAADLDITLTSPAGTIVKITTDNGAGNDNVYNGTLWSGDAPDPDHGRGDGQPRRRSRWPAPRARWRTTAARTPTATGR
jgi:subtilisin-like proprotein convertase family protein